MEKMILFYSPKLVPIHIFLLWFGIITPYPDIKGQNPES